MTLVTLVLWGLGVARVSAVESVLLNGEPVPAETHLPLLLQLGQIEEAKPGSIVWVLKKQTWVPMLSQLGLYCINSQPTIAFLS